MVAGGWMDCEQKNIHLKSGHRDANGRLKIVAPGIDVISSSVTVKSKHRRLARKLGKMDFSKFAGVLFI